MKVLITTNIPSPYFVDYANELSKYVDLTVVFELKKATDRDNRWATINKEFNFKYIYLKTLRISNESGLSFGIIKLINTEKFDRIIIANPTTPTGIVTLIYLRKHNIHFVIQSEGGFKKRGHGIKEKLKKYLMCKADYYLTGMGGPDDYFLQYGATLNKLKRYNFSSIKQNELIKKPLTFNEKRIIKKKLGVKFNNVILYVGQFIKRKDIPTLLKAYKGLDNDDTCLLLVGGTPNKEYNKIIKKLDLKNVIYKSFQDKKEIIKYYKISDVFVLPTKEDTWGLVINEAMNYGLPVVSTKNSIAALQLIKNGENGYLVDSCDYNKIHTHLLNLLSDDSLRYKIGINNIKKIKVYTIENMGKTIYNYLK